MKNFVQVPFCASIFSESYFARPILFVTCTITRNRILNMSDIGPPRGLHGVSGTNNAIRVPSFIPGQSLEMLPTMDRRYPPIFPSRRDRKRDRKPLTNHPANFVQLRSSTGKIQHAYREPRDMNIAIPRRHHYNPTRAQRDCRFRNAAIAKTRFRKFRIAEETASCLLSAMFVYISFTPLEEIAPIASLKIGSTLNPKNIKEGSDVYFECNVRANPRLYKLTWFHEKEELHHNATAGVVLSDHSLVLQSITRESAGGYTCMAANVEGRAKSNVVNLEVMFAPVCKHVLNSGGGWRHQNATPPPFNMPEEVHGALKHETISLVCEVEASPTNVTFHWTFNNSGDLSDVPSTKFTNEGTTSRLNYTPLTDMDYGVLGCWASNSVGHSKQPCLYQIIAAGRPYPLQNCTTYNLNGSWVRISCVEGYDGGLPQKFVAIVGKRRLESSIPSWEFQMLKPAKVALYAVNAKGSSDPYAIEVVLKGVAKFTGESTSSVDMSPILIGLGGTATGLGLIVTGVLMALWRRHAATPAKPKPPQQPSIATFAGKGEEEDGNPDLIPTTALTNHLTGKLARCVDIRLSVKHRWTKGD
ncbi:hypothetical protein P5V15_012466 [Pogonomyrmex californicus]